MAGARVDATTESKKKTTGETRTRKRKPRSANAPPAGDPLSVQRPAKNSEVVYRDLRHAIVTMELVPGTPIVERELTARYGISRTPLREAVLRLVEDRLVDVAPKSGTFVSRIPLSVVREGLVARKALEDVTVRAATEGASESELMGLDAIIQRQREMAAAGNEERFHRADEDFHAAIAAAARYPGIWDMIQQMRIQIERYRRLTLPQPGRMELVVEEHIVLLDAIRKRDPDLAAQRMREHLDKLQLDSSILRDLWPDYFIIDPLTDETLRAG